MPDDPWDPDNPPPYWVDEDGHFGGWMSEAEQAALDAQFAEAALAQKEAMAETPPDYAIDIADLRAGRITTGDDFVELRTMPPSCGRPTQSNGRGGW